MNLKLVYVNKVGYDFKGNVNYEFIFTDNDRTDVFDVFGEGWVVEPASGEACPPDEYYINAVGRLNVKDYELECACDNDFYSYMDAKDGVIAIAYELIDDTFTKYPRLCFHYGEELESVQAKLKRRKLAIDLVTDLDTENYEDDEDDN